MLGEKAERDYNKGVFSASKAVLTHPILVELIIRAY